MRPSNPTESAEIRRIILLRGKSSPEVLLGFDGTRHTLPALRIPSGVRVAEHLTAELRAAYGICAISLGPLALPSIARMGGERSYELMELRASGNEASLGKHWVTAQGILEDGFGDPADVQALRQAIAEIVEKEECVLSRPFGRLGWFEELEQWVQEEITPHKLRLNGRFRQLNGTPAFSLIRFETDGPAVWFKAVGPPNDREYPITLRLAQLFPCFLPIIVATRPEWNAWLSFEAEGPRLCDESCGLAAWNAVARDLAALQIQALGNSLHLLELGARDLRTQTLRERVKPFFEIVGDLMDRQRKLSPSPLSREELACLSSRIEDALSILDETDLPLGLGHLDLNPGNIIAPLTGCVFLDWAEAFVGHPFFTFEYLRQHFRKTFGLGSTEESNLTSCYLFPWRGLGSEKEIQRALELSPLLTVFACAVGSDLWSDPQRRNELRAAGFLRSLARRMQREERARRERSAPCPR